MVPIGRASARYPPRMADDESTEEVPNPVVLVDTDKGPAESQDAPEPGATGIYGLNPETGDEPELEDDSDDE